VAEYGIPWGKLRQRYQQLVEILSAASIDVNQRQSFQKEYTFLTNVLQRYDAIEQLQQQIHELNEQITQSTDAEFTELLREECSAVQGRLDEAVRSLDTILYPADEQDRQSAFIEIRAGTGGQEAALFANDLMRMYLLYATRRGWEASIVSASETDLGGYREVVLHIKGRDVYGDLRHESGVHRVQRVPATETSGRIHTSTATIAVLPEVSEVEEVTIDPKDLRIDVYRSSGAGGQHVNTTDSAVRITHIPSGIVVACQDERSQHKNKAKAMKVLQARLRRAHDEKRAAEQSEQRKQQIGTGERAEKVRTYNFPQHRVTDHQADITLKNLDMVLSGALDPIIDALRQRAYEERRKQPLPFVVS